MEIVYSLRGLTIVNVAGHGLGSWIYSPRLGGKKRRLTGIFEDLKIVPTRRLLGFNKSTLGVIFSHVPLHTNPLVAQRVVLR